MDNVKRLELGPGVKHAIIWLSIISSFGMGWYTRGQVTDGELANSALASLKGDIVAKSENRVARENDMMTLNIEREGRTYDKNCASMSISDFTK